MDIPKSRLRDEFQQRVEAKKAFHAELDARFGADRIKISSYMENLGWCDLFGYEMQQILDDVDFDLEQHLRQQIFWADNVADDSLPIAEMTPNVGWYWDMTLFGEEVRHSPIGVPEFTPHPLRHALDLDTLGHFDFYETGVMPQLIAKYQRSQEIAKAEYGGLLQVTFPCFNRGPLDIYVQLRGYEHFLEDVADRPDQVRGALIFLADERLRFAQARQKFLGEDALPPTTMVADDWVNIPFISPAIFREIVLPAYRRIRANEGPVTGFHTCGNIMAIIQDMLAVFPEFDSLDVSGWNDLRVLDELVPRHLPFTAAFIATVVLGDVPAEQRPILEAIADVGTRRKISAYAGGLLNMYSTYDDLLLRLSHFMDLAHEIFADHPTDS
jgi:hypothetical protein